VNTLLHNRLFSLLADCCLAVGKLHPADCWQTFSLLHTKGMLVPGCSFGIRRISWRNKETAICLIEKKPLMVSVIFFHRDSPERLTTTFHQHALCYILCMSIFTEGL